MTQNVKAVLLVGGMGTRLRSILPATPKPMASVGRGSFLDLLVRQLQCQGICRLVMCTGHLADQIENEFEDGKAWGVTIEYSREPEALGTGGAIKLAERYLLDTRDFLVMNGDSFLEIDLHKFIRFHRAHDGLASIAVWKAEDTARFGTVHVTSGGRVTAFAEKTGASGPGLINAGVYAFNQAVFQYIPAGIRPLKEDPS